TPEPIPEIAFNPMSRLLEATLSVSRFTCRAKNILRNGRGQTTDDTRRQCRHFGPWPLRYVAMVLTQLGSDPFVPVIDRKVVKPAAFTVMLLPNVNDQIETALQVPPGVDGPGLFITKAVVLSSKLLPLMRASAGQTGLGGPKGSHPVPLTMSPVPLPMMLALMTFAFVLVTLNPVVSLCRVELTRVNKPTFAATPVVFAAPLPVITTPSMTILSLTPAVTWIPVLPLATLIPAKPCPVMLIARLMKIVP